MQRSIEVALILCYRSSMAPEPTLQDVLTAVQTMDRKFEKRFSDTDQKFVDMDTRFDEVLEQINDFATHVEMRFVNIENEITQIKDKVNHMNSIMLTKDYLDTKLADLKADLVLLARKGNIKLSALIEQLVAQHILDQSIGDQILALEPFPQ